MDDFNSQDTYQSAIAPYIISFLEEKRSLGFIYKTEEGILRRFDKYCIDNKLKEPTISKSFLDEWLSITDSEKEKNLNKRICTTRQLMMYMNSIGIQVYVPFEYCKAPAPLPHIFSKPEYSEFFNILDSQYAIVPKRYVRLAKEYSVLFRLYAATGLRNSEACGIATSNVDLNNGALTIMNGKGHKDRLVYLDSELTQFCRDYYLFMTTELKFAPEWFFPGRNPRKPLANSNVDAVFKRIWNQTSFSNSCKNTPTVHDFRFSFITNRIDLWISTGENIRNLLPYLSQYVGHKDIEKTYYYYHLTNNAMHNIHKLDKTADIVIPEVTSYEHV